MINKGNYRNREDEVFKFRKVFSKLIRVEFWESKNFLDGWWGWEWRLF